VKLKALFLVSGLTLIIAVLLNTLNAAEAAAPPALDPARNQRILQATIQIALYEYDEGQGIEVGGRGLGTLVRHNGQTLIVTHDHWTHLNTNLREAEFRNARGDLLLTVPANTLLNLIRYRDGGTMILAAPAELAAMAPVALDPAVASAGQVAWVARRARHDGGNSVEVVAAHVETVEAEAGLPRLRLRGAGGAVVIPGDSGGGIWYDGQLQGNLWSGGVEIRTTWLDRLLGTSRQTETSLIYSALLPHGEITAIADGNGNSQSLATATAVQNLPEG